MAVLSSTLCLIYSLDILSVWRGSGVGDRQALSSALEGMKGSMGKRGLTFAFPHRSDVAGQVEYPPSPLPSP